MQTDTDDWKIDGGLYINSYHFKSISFKNIIYSGNVPLSNSEIIVDFYESSAPEKILYTLGSTGNENGEVGSGMSQFLTKDSVKYSIVQSYEGSDYLAMKITILYDNGEESTQTIPIVLRKIGMIQKNK